MDIKSFAHIEIAKTYIDLLERGDITGVISLFSDSGKVHSPIYGEKDAGDFYTDLANDTTESKLTTNGIFAEPNSNRVALYFNYEWTLKDGKIVNFDVVDIIVFDEEGKISELRIIYDTVKSRGMVRDLEQSQKV
ncbi:MAG: ketosteroid isomerase-like protein [Saprospiraceae bacterium]|jgi:ketosteroid isomerase-like protein